MFDIDTCSDVMVELWFQRIFKEMETNPNAPYDYKVSTRIEWIEFLDRKVDEMRHTISISRIVAKNIIGELK